jgi:hypothetical protein
MSLKAEMGKRRKYLRPEKPRRPSIAPLGKIRRKKKIHSANLTARRTEKKPLCNHENYPKKTENNGTKRMRRVVEK